MLLLYCRMLRIEERVQNQFVFACGKVEVRSRLMVDSRLTLQVFSQETLTLCYSLLSCHMQCVQPQPTQLVLQRDEPGSFLGGL